MKKLIVLALVLGLGLCLATKARAEDKVLFSYEKDAQGWEIPEWAKPPPPRPW